MPLPRPTGTDAVPWRAVCDQAASPMTVLDMQGRFLYVNQALCRLLRCDREELVRNHRKYFIHPDDRAAAELFNEVVAAPSGEVCREFRCVRSDGAVIWLLLCASLVRDDGGRPVCVTTHAQDITERRESEARWQQTFTRAPIGMALLDTRGRWTEVNAALCRQLGYSCEELLAVEPSDLTYPGDDPTAAVADVVEGLKDTASLETCFRHKLGYPVWLFVRISAVQGPDGHAAYLVGQYEEIGDGRMTDDHLAHLALHDPLTGLANRVLLTDRLDQSLAELPRTGGVLAVLLVDLDELKLVNDRHGHLVGDQLLMSAADALLRAARPGDTVARFGGDEFVVVSRVVDQQAAEALRRHVEGFLHDEIDASGIRLPLRASVGLASTADPSTSRSDLLHAADQSMYSRKHQSQI
ncbi:diguanylate cyclase [Saccharopolyspora erythraea]|uniref:diguanylate cyclase domain-containing protein n=1 Tax=Saccharopolyspora erythraea TaxID=1836 RepID=UPI001BA5F75C|nr:diguanylate cyclase [Saccharopolyspora erythraea]QUH02304.1 diguanylate cyclase [Saccharopolyspora erythraea]